MTARVRSGELELFYRRFGAPGGTPLLFLHGANYYDSADFIAVAGALAGDREVAAFDARGFGESDWSPSKDYSVSAQLADITAVLDDLGWERAVLAGHSRGGGFALAYAAANPARVAGLVLIDNQPGYTPPPPSEGGQVNVRRRDPDFRQGGGFAAGYDPWAAWASVQVPTLAIHATRSHVFDAESLARIARELPRVAVVPVDAEHDVAGTAPQALVAAIADYLPEAP